MVESEYALAQAAEDEGEVPGLLRTSPLLIGARPAPPARGRLTGAVHTHK